MRLPRFRCRVCLTGILLAVTTTLARGAESQGNAPGQPGDATSTVTDYIRAVDGILSIQVALGQASPADADGRLEATVQGFVARGAPAAELITMRSELQVAASGFFADLDRGIAGATSFPGPLPTEVSRALARRLLGTARSKFIESLADGGDPLPVLAQAAKVLARVRGLTDLPRELDRFADAAERAERLAARMPAPPPVVGPVATGAPRPSQPTGPIVPGGPGPGTMGSGGPPPVAGTPQSGAPVQPGPYPAPTPAPGPGPVAMGNPQPARPPSSSTSALPGMTGSTGGVGPQVQPISTPPGQMSPSPGTLSSRPAPATLATTAPPRTQAVAPSGPVIESDPLLAVLGVGTMEAEARLEGFGWMDVVGRTWPPASDGEPDTEILLKLSAPGLILDWIEVRSAPDPTELIWTTNGAPGTMPIGLALRTRLLNDASGSVAGLQIEDFVVLSLYVQDDGFLERLEQPGTITITYRGGDVATIPIEPLW
jgi:hypothetical protein